MSYATIQVQQTTVSTVADDGTAVDELSVSEARYVCVDPRCNLSFADWADATAHCAVYHRDPVAQAAVVDDE